MPRYFFHVRAGADLVTDEEGSLLPDDDAVRCEAARTLADVLEGAPDLWPGGDWHLVVTDEAGSEVVTLSAWGRSRPASLRQPIRPRGRPA